MGKRLVHLWAGSISARTVWNDSPWKDGLSDVELPYDVCPSCDFNLLCTFQSWHMFRPNGNVLTVCSVCFLTEVLIRGLSRAFLRSQMMALPKQDYPGAAKALLKTGHLPHLE